MPTLARFGNGQNAPDPLPPDRVHWQVKECLVSSWHDLAEPYSLDQMWRFLQQGRYSHALPVEDVGGPVTR